MSGHADRYSQADREKDTMTPAKQALRMSGHAETEVEFALLRLCALHTRAVQAFNDHGIEEPQP